MHIFNRRTEITSHQLEFLEEFYKKDNKPGSGEIDRMARYVNLKFEITQVIKLYLSLYIYIQHLFYYLNYNNKVLIYFNYLYYQNCFLVT